MKFTALQTAKPAPLRRPMVLALTVLGLLGAAPFSQAADFLEVYQAAQSHDSVYASSRSLYTANLTKLTQGRSTLLPQIGASWSTTRSEFNVENPDSTRRFSNTGWSISLTQPLFRWANWETYKQGELAALAAEAQLSQAQQDLITRVATAYFDVLSAQDTLSLTTSKKKSIAEQLAQAKRNFEVGTATITDTNEAQARYDLAIAQEIAAQSDVDNKKATLTSISGMNQNEALKPLKANANIPGPQPADMQEWLKQADAQNYGIALAQIAWETAQRETSKARAGHLPTVDLVASRSHNNQTGSTLTTSSSVTNNSQIGIQVNFPIFSGFGTQAVVNQNYALAQKAMSDLESARRTTAIGTQQAYLGVSSGLAQVKALEAAERSAQSALESNKLGYEVGVRINIDVLNAQDQLFTTRRDLAKARYDTIVNGLKLKAAASVLKEDDVGLVNSLLGDAPAKVAPPAATKNTPNPPSTKAGEPAAKKSSRPKQTPMT